MDSYPLEITDLKFFYTRKEGSKTKAFATATFNDTLIVGGITIKEGKKGIYVGFPVRDGGNGKKWPMAYPASGEARKEISNRILAAYVIQADLEAEPVA